LKIEEGLTDKNVNLLKDPKPFLSYTLQQSTERDGSLYTDTIEKLNLELVPVEFKLHISLLMDIQRLFLGLQNLF
jgi:hypothetical protein